MNDMHWLLPKDEMPPDDCEVIVSVRDETGDGVFRYTSVGWHNKVFGDGIWVVDNELCRGVEAWMPLPEPYRRRS